MSEVYGRTFEMQPMRRVSCYVDGFNLYHAINEARRQKLKWLSLVSVARLSLCPGDVLTDVHYFTAVMHWNKVKAQRHREYMRALECSGVKVVDSYFVNNDRICRKLLRVCPFYEEKQTDVGLATRVCEMH